MGELSEHVVRLLGENLRIAIPILLVVAWSLLGALLRNRHWRRVLIASAAPGVIPVVILAVGACFRFDERILAPLAGLVLLNIPLGLACCWWAQSGRLAVFATSAGWFWLSCVCFVAVFQHGFPWARIGPPPP